MSSTGTNKQCSSEHHQNLEVAGWWRKASLCEHSLSNKFSGNSFKFSFIIKADKKWTCNFVWLYSISKSWIAGFASVDAADDRNEFVMLSIGRSVVNSQLWFSIRYIYIKKLGVISLVSILLSFLSLLHLYTSVNFSSRTPDLYNLSQWVQSKQREIGN